MVISTYLQWVFVLVLLINNHALINQTRRTRKQTHQLNREYAIANGTLQYLLLVSFYYSLDIFPASFSHFVQLLINCFLFRNNKQPHRQHDKQSLFALE